ncbi:hypothetical protein AB674_17640 [Flavobacterium sp. ABG]|nr:hypothetical protein AB674_17640 [Flavobacterium sp. ABG]
MEFRKLDVKIQFVLSTKEKSHKKFRKEKLQSLSNIGCDFSLRRNDRDIDRGLKSNIKNSKFQFWSLGFFFLYKYWNFKFLILDVKIEFV